MSSQTTPTPAPAPPPSPSPSTIASNNVLDRLGTLPYIVQRRILEFWIPKIELTIMMGRPGQNPKALQCTADILTIAHSTRNDPLALVDVMRAISRRLDRRADLHRPEEPRPRILYPGNPNYRTWRRVDNLERAAAWFKRGADAIDGWDEEGMWAWADAREQEMETRFHPVWGAAYVFTPVNP